MLRASARQRLLSIISAGRQPIGAFVMSPDAAMTAVFGISGYDFVIIDAEHGANDRRSVLEHVRVAEQNGILPFVRVLENHPALIQSMLDLGAHGIVVPKIGSAAEAAKALAATKYQPGGRGLCGVTESAGWGSYDWQSYASEANDNILMIPLIETAEGVRNIAEISAVDGIDYLLFGHGDLSQDLGLPFGPPSGQLQEIWRKCQSAVHRNGAKLGCHLPAGFEAADFGTITADMKLVLEGAKTTLGRYQSASTIVGEE